MSEANEYIPQYILPVFGAMHVHKSHLLRGVHSQAARVKWPQAPRDDFEFRLSEQKDIQLQKI